MLEERYADVKEIERNIAVIHEANEVIEVRALSEADIATGFFSDHRQAAAAIKRLSDSEEYEGIYITLNPCNKDLLGRRKPNYIHHNVKGTTSNKEITAIRWLFLDFDYQRPTGTSTTELQKATARWCMINTKHELHTLGLPNPIVGDSGNCSHLLYRINLPNNKKTEKLIKDLLQALNENYGLKDYDDKNQYLVAIDTEVYNPGRLTKAYGSIVKKGAASEERPHRFSGIISVPPNLSVVPVEQLESLLDTLNANKKKKPSMGLKNSPMATAEKVEEFLQWGNVEVKKSPDNPDGTKQWILTVCPFNPEHVNSPAVSLDTKGVLGYHCFHQSCADNHWKQFRQEIESKKGERFDFGRSDDWGNQYQATPSGIFHHTFTGGDPIIKRLTNFDARIVKDVEQDDGVEVKHELEIQVAIQGGTRRFCIPASEFNSLTWVLEKLGAGAIIADGVGTKDHVRFAIQIASEGSIEQDRVFTHTGWRSIDGAQYYLHSGGAIGAEGLREGIRVRIPVKGFCLPAPPTGTTLAQSVRASMRILDVAERHLTIPLFAAIFRSVLGGAYHSHHVTGHSGTYKSSYVALLMNFFSATGEFDCKNLPGSWHSTSNANAGMQFILKDTIFPIDDFVPRGSKSEIDHMHKEADRIFRGQGNRSGRSRMGRDGDTIRPPKPPRCLTISTGEETPRGLSVQARVLIQDVKEGDVNTKKLTACQRDAADGLFAQAMAGFLQWLAPRYNSMTVSLPRYIEKYRARAIRDNGHARTPEITANLIVGVNVFLRFATEMKILSQAEARKIRRDAWVALLKAATTQTNEQASQEPARKFLDLIAAALVRGDAYLGSADTGKTADDYPKGKLIGWFSSTGITYLDPDSSFAVAQNLAQQQGEALSIGMRTLWKRLREGGILAKCEEEQNTPKAKIGTGWRRVLWIKTSDIYPQAEANMEDDYEECEEVV